MRLTRSAYLSALRCPKKMYYQLHGQPRESGPDLAARMFSAQTRRVGELARRSVGTNPGESWSAPWGGPGGEAVAVEETARALADPSLRVIFDGAFESGGIFVRADILERLEDGVWRVRLVKSSASLKENNLNELALIKHVLGACGLRLDGFMVMHLNRGYVFSGGDYDLCGLFSIREVSEALPPSEERLLRELPRIREILEAPEPPVVSVGPQCQRSSRCDFFDCCQAGPSGSDSLGCLPETPPELLEQLAGMGIAGIRDIPADFPLNPRQRRARLSCQNGGTVFEPGLASELKVLRYPLLFVDFEASSPALPRFAGMHPFDPLPFQWSLHIQAAPGQQPRHVEFLDCGPGDPREGFIRSLVQATAGLEGSVVVYNKDFESDRLKEAAVMFPELAGPVESLRRRLWDLCAVVQNNVYHPGMCGSFSIKNVLPALLPGMSYEALPVNNGVTAGAVHYLLVENPPEDAERERLESELRQYCLLDTLAMLRLVEYLQELVAKGKAQSG
ncbi:DUF2779 domain-containing protein [bacterium]|nr:DUF2779 domain-containing protein [bacterium]